MNCRLPACSSYAPSAGRLCPPLMSTPPMGIGAPMPGGAIMAGGCIMPPGGGAAVAMLCGALLREPPGKNHQVSGNSTPTVPVIHKRLFSAKPHHILLMAAALPWLGACFFVVAAVCCRSGGVANKKP